jgi:hypothetical protein
MSRAFKLLPAYPQDQNKPLQENVLVPTSKCQEGLNACKDEQREAKDSAKALNPSASQEKVLTLLKKNVFKSQNGSRCMYFQNLNSRAAVGDVPQWDSTCLAHGLEFHPQRHRHAHTHMHTRTGGVSNTFSSPVYYPSFLMKMRIQDTLTTHASRG